MSRLSRFRWRMHSFHHSCLLRLFPKLRELDALQKSIDHLRQETSRLTAELAIALSAAKTAQASEATSSLAARNAIERANSLAIANEQLQSQLTTTLQESLDRIERAYGSFANWQSIGGATSRTPIYPHLPIGERPKIEERPIGQMPSRNARGQANRLTAETMAKIIDRNRKPDPEAEKDMEEVLSKVSTGEWFTDAAGNIRVSKTNDIVRQTA